MGCSPPGSFVHGIPLARRLEGVAISLSRGPSQPRNQTRVPCIGRRILYHWTTREVQEWVGRCRNMRRVWCHSSDATCARLWTNIQLLCHFPFQGKKWGYRGRDGRTGEDFTRREKDYGFYLEDNGWRWLLVCFGKSLWFLGDKALVWWRKPGADSLHGRLLQSSRVETSWWPHRPVLGRTKWCGGQLGAVFPRAIGI